ncbi:hypothetical protein [Streptococcus sp. 20-1249]|uniref:hypothetical protein n=1 Tax=Streptococcus hepaticus TaxID=3349163 RepID=UPI003748555B
MLAVQKDGNYTAYINGAAVAQGRNAAMANRTDIALRVEGSGRKNGDSLKAVFSNIKLSSKQMVCTKLIRLGEHMNFERIQVL